MKKLQNNFFTGIKIICNICVQDVDGNLRKYITVEGEKSQDKSIYFVVWKNNSREDVMKYSYHAKQTIKGLVQTHVGTKNLKKISRRFQISLADRKKAIFCILGMNVKVDQLELINAHSNDILISIKNEYLNQCVGLFYTTEECLSEYVNRSHLIVLHKYRIPVKSVNELNFAILMEASTLQNIQQSYL